MSAALFDLTGRTALVTGSSRGLGFAIAEGLAGAGARVILNGVDEGRLAAAAAQLRTKGFSVREACFDVTDEAAIMAAFAVLDADTVEVDILVNNAGIQLRKPMLDISGTAWRKVVDTNLTGAFMIGREAARRMLARGRGKIINIGSLTSELGQSGIGPYVASKGGIKMLTRAMASEWAGQGIQANAIGPGYMITDMSEVLRADTAFDSWMKARTPAKRWGEPRELVGCAVFLASAASDYVNGQIIYVDGGFTAVM